MKQQAENDSNEPNLAAPGSTIVYFDGTCPLCTLEIGHYAKQAEDGRLTFVDVSAETSELGANLSPSAAMNRFHVRLADGSLVSGSRAFVAVWDTLPKWRWAARLARWPGVLAVLEFGYRLFLPVRPLLSGAARRLGARPANRSL